MLFPIVHCGTGAGCAVPAKYTDEGLRALIEKTTSVRKAYRNTGIVGHRGKNRQANPRSCAQIRLTGISPSTYIYSIPPKHLLFKK
jgi:hypothetical protein